MAYRWNKTDLKNIGALRGAATKMQERLMDLQAEWDNSTEEWQESDRGQAVQDWLTEMEDKFREVGDLADEVEDSEPEQ